LFLFAAICLLIKKTGISGNFNAATAAWLAGRSAVRRWQTWRGESAKHLKI
jgi:hypothetical protein